MSVLLTAQSLVMAAVETEHHEVNGTLSWGIGVVTLVLLLGLLLGLMAFGKGREHS